MGKNSILIRMFVYIYVCIMYSNVTFCSTYNVVPLPTLHITLLNSPSSNHEIPLLAHMYQRSSNIWWLKYIPKTKYIFYVGTHETLTKMVLNFILYADAAKVRNYCTIYVYIIWRDFTLAAASPPLCVALLLLCTKVCVCVFLFLPHTVPPPTNMSSHFINVYVKTYCDKA